MRYQLHFGTAALISAMTLALLGAVSCKKPAAARDDDGELKIAAPFSPGEPGPMPVSFVLTPVTPQWDLEKGAEWLCTHTAGKHTARFRIRTGPAKPIGDGVYSGRGEFLAESGSDPSALLPELKAALLAKSLPANVKRRQNVPFEIVILGRNMAHRKGSGFSGTGKWTATKLFFAQGDDESQVFFNLDPADHVGEFSMKDEDYGDHVLRELAQVL